MGQVVKISRVVSLNGKKRFGGKISHTKPRAYYPCYSGAGQEIGEVTLIPPSLSVIAEPFTEGNHLLKVPQEGSIIVNIHARF